MPALAVADALRGRGAEVSVVGARGASSAGRAQAAGYPEDHISLRGFSRRLSPGAIVANLRTVVLTIAAVPRAAAVLRRRRADVVVGAGGYVAGPVALAAWLTRRPVVLMEADSHMGVANRLAAPLARRVTLAFPLRGRSGPRYLVTGRPVSAAVVSATRTSGRRAFGIDPGATMVVVVGGSQGARTLNVAAAGAFGDQPPIDVVHVAGPTQLDQTRELLGAHDPGPRYRLVGWLDNLPEAIAAADLVVSRSGGSVFELAAIGRPSILVPYPYATADHQAKNARWLAEAGAAVVLPDAECTGERLRALVGALLADRRRLQGMADAAAAVGRPGAAEAVAQVALEVARGPRSAGPLRRACRRIRRLVPGRRAA